MPTFLGTLFAPSLVIVVVEVITEVIAGDVEDVANINVVVVDYTLCSVYLSK